MYCVRRVKAADVMEEGRPRPLMTSCHSFLLITSTRPPRAQTRLYSSYKSNTCLAIIGSRLIGVPEIKAKMLFNTFFLKILTKYIGEESFLRLQYSTENLLKAYRESNSYYISGHDVQSQLIGVPKLPNEELLYNSLPAHTI